MRHAEILFDVAGQVLYLDPPEIARASAPSCTVYELAQDDDGPTESATTGAASVDSVGTALTVAATAGDVELTVSDTTGITRAGRYLVAGADGLAEHVDVVAVGTTVRVQRPLVNDYAIGATFQGTRISIAIDTTWGADSTNLETGYRVRWTYTSGGSVQLAVTYFDLVRYQARALVTAQDVDSRFPGWIDRLPPDHRENQGASLIDAAFQAVKMDALGDAAVLRRLRDSQIIRELTLCKANLLAIENQVYAGGGNLDGMTAARDLYTQRYQQLVRQPKAPSDTGSGGGATAPAERLPVWRR